MPPVELDPQHFRFAAEHGFDAEQTRHETARFVAWRRTHRFRGESTEAWTLWIELRQLERATHAPRVPEFNPESARLNARDREVGRAGVAAAKAALRR